ncbi:MAG: hypothetical protein IJU20_08570 [Clostridia bacterium]|nr:hypothetical protein [Clostridia bacterium]
MLFIKRFLSVDGFIINDTRPACKIFLFRPGKKRVPGVFCDGLSAFVPAFENDAADDVMMCSSPFRVGGMNGYAKAGKLLFHDFFGLTVQKRKKLPGI